MKYGEPPFREITFLSEEQRHLEREKKKSACRDIIFVVVSQFINGRLYFTGNFYLVFY